MSDVWDVIVVGAGVMGCWTAYHLARNKVKTLVLEQFSLPHTRGSSHGKSRIIRHMYHKDLYTAMMPEAYDWWRSLEQDCGKTLLKRTGLVLVEPEQGKEIPESAAAMSRQGLPYQIIDGKELKRRYPQLNYPDTYRGLVDAEAGLLDPDACLRALHNQLEILGVRIQDAEPVLSINPEAHRAVTVKTRLGLYRAKRVVVNAGPWAGPLLERTGLYLPLKAMPGLGGYWKERIPDSHSVDKGFPLVLAPTVSDGNAYRFFALFPSLEFPGYLKIVTRGEPPARYCHPDQRDMGSNDEMVTMATDYVRRYLPGIEDKPSVVEPCMYTMTPDRDYIIDYHPMSRDIAVGAGFSGHGFKLAPVVGKLLAEMVTDIPASYDLHPFRISRFNESKL